MIWPKESLTKPEKNVGELVPYWINGVRVGRSDDDDDDENEMAEEDTVFSLIMSFRE
jgi:hypothetical protein